jgi:hypothetical protein
LYRSLSVCKYLSLPLCVCGLFSGADMQEKNTLCRIYCRDALCEAFAQNLYAHNMQNKTVQNEIFISQ